MRNEIAAKGLWLVGLLMGAVLAHPGNAVADVGDFYKGKSVNIIVGFPTGGGYDAYARAIARTFGSHIPGNPTVIVQNMAGAGSLRAARYLQDVAPHDGTTFGTFDNGLLLAAIMAPSDGFDASKLSWIGAVSKDLQMIITRDTSHAKTVDDLRKGETVFGATGRDDIRYTSTNVLKKLLGANIKIVTGYPGTTDIRVAMERGEIDGISESWSSLKSTKPEWIEQKKINVLLQFGFSPHPELPTVPMIGTFARSPTELTALELIFSPSEAGRPYAAPPQIPADRLTALRRAFDATMKDKDFIAFTTQAKLDVGPSTGEEVAGFLSKAYGSSSASIETARKLLEP
ncbi:MAG TPA: tripartite tricarboxylate transporter substrate-binding protein [Alphaproteobacteria bacterium]|nr:tripartite tricarboxylate transporter substrate-binding protein [Alphaproteobacteria bacterium]